MTTAVTSESATGVAFVRQRMRSVFDGTPGRLRIVGAITIGVALVFVVVGALAVNERARAIDGARTDSAQSVRVQAVRTNLVQADAFATNAFLVGGLEPPEQRASYQQRIATVAELVAQAAGGDARDADLLSAVNDDVARYIGLIESARANNRQGFPVGVAYLKQASTLLRDDTLPALGRLSDRTAERLAAHYADADAADGALWAIGGIAILLLVGAQVWLLRRTRRVFNVAMVAATVFIAGATLAAGALMAVAQHDANDTEAGPSADALRIAQARVAAFDAKSAESLTLIARGSGEVFEERFQANATEALAALEGGGTGLKSQGSLDALTAYLDLHVKIRTLDDGGDWDAAVELATKSGDGGANAIFIEFDQQSKTALGSAAGSVDDRLKDARIPLAGASALVLIGGFLAATGASRGISVRLREYR